MPKAWRIVKPYRVAGAFSGEGARLYGGRWNPIGLPMVYTAESKALAALEILVHVDSSELLNDFLCIPIHFDERLLNQLEMKNLPEDWRSPLPPVSTQSIGEQWIRDGSSVILAVPSVLVPGENNYLLNPRHPRFSELRMGAPEPFEFDLRLLKQA